MAQCPNCSSSISDPSNRFCPNCGAILPLVAAPPPGPARPTPPPVPPAPVPPPAAAPLAVREAAEEAPAALGAAPDAWAPPPPPPPPPPFGGGPGGSGGGGGGRFGSPPGGGEPPRSGTPWDDRERLGLGTALVETTREVLLTPVGFFRRMPVTGGLGGPFFYGLLLGYVGIVIGAFYDAVLQTVTGSVSPFAVFGREAEFERVASALAGWTGFFVQLAVGPIFMTIALFLGAGITHLCLMMLGGAKQGFEATFRVWAFGQAAGILAVVPFCGTFVGGLYRLVLAVLGLAEAHGISRGTAAIAVILPLLLVCCCCGVILALMAGSLASLANLGH
jgi:hypothetical protein